MVVNESKTEIMWIGNDKVKNQIKINNVPCSPIENMKAFGIYIDGNLKWDFQAEESIKKCRKLASVFGHLRKYMTESQFLKAVTANYYSYYIYYYRQNLESKIVSCTFQGYMNPGTN